ncbi:MAG: ribonuclease III [Calditrichaeota bacterium]|nr:ribonuclease III [Calditrichota bacterium]
MLHWLRQQVQKVFSNSKPRAPRIDFDALRETLAYDFKNEALFVQALKHRSYLPISQEQRIDSNERLELLGDAVLGLVVVEFLFRRYPNKEEGELTNMKSLVVSRRILAKISRTMRLGKYFLLSAAEEKSGGRNRASINSDAIEAIISAIYLDGGLESARQFIHDKILATFEDMIQDERHTNFKSMLLEYSQSQNLGSPSYYVQSVEGPDHERIFTIEVRLQDDMLGFGTANSKKHAEQLAARQALKSLYII